ncbi:unnamed protein product [Sphenostylis stenocarpa]|uniref:Uncharacterized protein n=1 Tax=Sphenostylis stenocarpa TaxID=92480 RepID=A0AA86SVP0_9FABA|nr:unnamed protein product [Sphenostylis stenocarpa]
MACEVGPGLFDAFANMAGELVGGVVEVVVALCDRNKPRRKRFTQEMKNSENSEIEPCRLETAEELRRKKQLTVALANGRVDRGVDHMTLFF